MNQVEVQRSKHGTAGVSQCLRRRRYSTYCEYEEELVPPPTPALCALAGHCCVGCCSRLGGRAVMEIYADGEDATAEVVVLNERAKIGQQLPRKVRAVVRATAAGRGGRRRTLTCLQMCCHNRPRRDHPDVLA